MSLRTRCSQRLSRKPTVLGLALALVIGLGVPARSEAPPAAAAQAQQRAATLDALFAKLKSARDQAEADVIAGRIWKAWMASGRDDIDVLLSKAVASMAARHFGLALLLLDEIVDLAPDFAEGWNKRATLHYEMGQYKAALADIAKALELEPRHFGALAGRAAVYVDTGRWVEALEAYRAALAINPYLGARDKILPELEKRAGERKS
jgi:tetratricopeptide (TPR) repeat protein